MFYAIFGTSDGGRLWVAGSRLGSGGNGGVILKSDDGGKHWNPRINGTGSYLHSIFVTSDGQRLWAVGDKGTILASVDGGEHWNARSSGTANDLKSIFGTSDGRRGVGCRGWRYDSGVGRRRRTLECAQQRDGEQS